MGPWTVKMRLAHAWTYVRHPLHAWGAVIAFRYCERNGLAIHFDCSCSEPDYQDEHCPIHGRVASDRSKR